MHAMRHGPAEQSLQRERSPDEERTESEDRAIGEQAQDQRPLPVRPPDGVERHVNRDEQERRRQGQAKDAVDNGWYTRQVGDVGLNDSP